MLELQQSQNRLSEFDGFLPKPVDEQKLLEMMERLLGLEWVYKGAQESEEADELGDLRVPSTEMLEGLYELVMVGDIWGLQEKVQQLRDLDQRYGRFAHQIQSLAQNIDEQGLINLFEQHLAITGR